MTFDHSLKIMRGKEFGIYQNQLLQWSMALLLEEELN